LMETEKVLQSTRSARCPPFVLRLARRGRKPGRGTPSLLHGQNTRLRAPLTSSTRTISSRHRWGEGQRLSQMHPQAQLLCRCTWPRRLSQPLIPVNNRNWLHLFMNLLYIPFLLPQEQALRIATILDLSLAKLDASTAPHNCLKQVRLQTGEGKVIAVAPQGAHKVQPGAPTQPF